MTQKQKQNLDWTPVLTGGTAALVTESLVYPFSTIVTRIQSESSFYAVGGFRNLYRGVSSVILCTIPSASVFFVVYEHLKRIQRPGTRNHLVSSAIAELASCAILAPAEYVRQQVQTTALAPSKALKKLFSSRRSLWRSFVGMSARNVPLTSFQFTLYENIKTRFSSEHTSFAAVKGAALSAAITAAVSTPLDVIKTYMNLNSYSYWEALCAIFRTQGLLGFCKGVSVRVLSASVGFSIYLGVYDYLTGHLSFRERSDDSS
ncbi:tricarboxylate transporter [Schizosaccharomyces japonicus yFS275]|uniref:Tricarboxylate transporter n=1 Tax=Schizosaccharomyces japonicus (strain yFS275 / FY16936) TaxID=402676 RepID=B6JYC9_SCHJY|nr:tricarboxylate transporter [Schizosaccharomyces japonicus yFS275]EEB06547.1 tricarboxylate transporter [Schizosaccharomyces japonicus yFS275]